MYNLQYKDFSLQVIFSKYDLLNLCVGWRGDFLKTDNSTKPKQNFLLSVGFFRTNLFNPGQHQAQSALGSLILKSQCQDQQKDNRPI